MESRYRRRPLPPPELPPPEGRPLLPPPELREGAL
jgi:hypothetical protein